MTFFIPPRDRPIETERYVDPVTGARIVRPRRYTNPDSNSAGGPLPATCATPYCTHNGLPHDRCDPRQYYQPAYQPNQYGTSGCHSEYQPPFEMLPNPGPYSGADDAAFRQWICSHPHWKIPREMPPGWRQPERSDIDGWPNQFSYAHQRTPNTYPTPLPSLATAAAGWPTGSALPNRQPDLMEWENVEGGRLQWTPHPWVPHPLPHPNMPAQGFWHGYASPWQSWQGPGGWTPGTGRIDPARMHWITGGHPLPGHDPYWTPSTWVQPLYNPPSNGVIISPYLAPNPRNANVPQILWDAAIEHPSRIKRVTGRGGIAEFANSESFKLPATFPKVTTLQVHLPHMRKSWGPVNVKKSTPIEIGDIFYAVWDYLQKPIKYSDVESVLYSPGGPERWHRIQYASFRRCYSAPALAGYEQMQGVRRADFLEGQSIYWGLWPCYNADGTWYLCMGFLPHS